MSLQLKHARFNWKLWGIVLPVATMWYYSMWMRYFEKDIAYIWIAILIYFVVFAVLFQKIIKIEGRVQADIKNGLLVIKFSLLGLGARETYEIDQITKLRVTDRGNRRFELGFNYGIEEDYILLGGGHSEEDAETLYEALRLRLRDNDYNNHENL